MSGLRRITDLNEFVALCELANITYDALHANKGQWAEEDVATEMGFEVRDEIESKSRFDSRMTLRLRAPDAEYKVSVTGRVQVSEPVAVDEQLMTEYLSTTLGFVLFPYLRSAVTDLAARMNAQKPLPGFLRQGALEIQDQRGSVFAEEPISEA